MPRTATRTAVRTVARAALVSTLVLHVACRDTTGPNQDLADAALVNLAISSMSVISLTDIPKAGRPFEVRVQSYGLDGCWVADRAVVSADESGATITPYNRRDVGPSGGCYQVILPIPHRITLTFASPGTKTIAVRARDFTTREPVRFEVQVTVTP
jgi:hypothetical protein